MCGICGTTLLPPPAGVAEVQDMVGRLAHRGPGDRRAVVAGGAVLGSARLHVTAPRAPSGPHATRDGQVTAVVNGQIWNHAELRAHLRAVGEAVPDGSDTNVVAPLFRRYGIAGLARLRGMFALALHDGRSGTTVLARDRFGIKPLYVQAGPPLRFASEFSALPGGGGLDADALRDYLTLGFVPSPRTLDRAVRKVPPGTAWVHGPDGVREERFAFAPSAGDGAVPDAREVREVLGAAVERHLMGDVPIGVYLSGGVDSAAVSALVASGGRPVDTFALSFPGEGRYDEGAAAADTARLLGATHHEVPFPAADLRALVHDAARHFGEPFGDPSALAVLALSRRAAERVTVVLTGTGADELFAGYRRYGLGAVPGWASALASALATPASRVLPASRRTSWGTAGSLLRKLRRVRATDPAERYLGALEVVPAHWRASLLGDDAPPPALARMRAAFDGASSFADGARRADFDLYLPDDVLAKEDRMAMAASLENRVPFLDDALADVVGAVPARALGVGPLGRGKRLLRDSLAGDLPRRVRDRRKHGFAVPVSEYLRGPHRGLVDDLLLARDARVGGLLDAAAVAGIVRAHRHGDDDLGLAVYALVALEASLRVG